MTDMTPERDAAVDPTSPTDPAAQHADPVGDPALDPAAVGVEEHWDRTCSECGTELAQAVVDLDKSNADRPELRPGEMVAVDYCPNPTCPANKPDGWEPDSASLPGSMGGDNGGA